MISDQMLLAWNRKGFIPGPTETDEQFLARVNLCQELEKSHLDPLREEFNSPKTETRPYLEEAFSLTNPLFDIEPTWAPILFSNKGLAPWHGACAWICQLEKNGPITSFLQLRRNMVHSSKLFFGLYSRHELIAHELAHIGRMAFDEPIFEEFFSYQSSQSHWRRWLGPIVQSAREMVLFVSLLIFITILNTILMITDPQTYAPIAVGIAFIPIGVIAYAFIRLIIRHHTFQKCHDNLSHLIKHQYVNNFMYRLSDKEIKEISKIKISDLESYISKKPILSLRWRLIQLAYCVKKAPLL